MDDTDAPEGPLDPRAAADRMLALRERALADQGAERVAPGAGVAGRVLAEPVVAPADLPPHDVATMDGYAFAPEDGYPLHVRDDQSFPEDDPGALDAGEAVRIATGAFLPERASAVLKVEEATVESGELRGPTIEAGTDVYQQGSNVSAGETVVEAGERLAPRDAILLADLGVEPLVRAPFTVGVLGTGSELHAGEEPDRDSPMLRELLASWGHDPTYEGTVPDEEERVREAVSDLADTYDVVVTSGGTSVGTKDYVERTFGSLGDIAFRGLAVRPGGPVVVADLEGAIGIGVPGKPIGAHTVALLALRPFFAGETALPTVPATMACDLPVPDREGGFVVPVTLAEGTEGTEATPLGHRDSALPLFERFDPNVLSSATRTTRADGFVLTDEALGEDQRVGVVLYESVE